MPPRVSVVVTTYNQAAYIGAAVRSVLDQTYPEVETVVVDDGSTDGTAGELAPFRDRVRYVYQPNQGIAAARNTGVRHGTGPLVAFLDGDDLWSREKLEIQVEASLRNPDAGLIVVDGVYFDGSQTLSDSLFSADILSRFGDQERSVRLNCYRLLLEKNLITTVSQVLAPRAVLEQAGPSDTALRLGSDWDLYLRVAASHEVVFLREKLMRWRYLPTSASGPRALRHLAWAADEIAVLRKRRRAAPPELRGFIQRLLKEKILRTAENTYYVGINGHMSWARRQFLALLRRNPGSIALATFFVALHLPRRVNRVLSGGMRRALRP